MSHPELLERELVRLLAERRPGVQLMELWRSPMRCRSSWTLEDLVLGLSDGTSLPLVWKDLDREGPGSRALSVKPRQVSDPRREGWIYENVLARVGEGAGLWGAVSDEREGIHWLFLEPVPGVPLCEIGEIEAWTAAAAWLGRFHARFLQEPPRADLLLGQEARLHRWWYRRALVLANGRAPELRWMEAQHRVAVDRVLAGPVTLLHGEFYPANVIVSGRGPRRRVVPVDWEMAGLGPPALDLAALTSGSWSDEERAAMVSAYRDGCVAAGGTCPAPDELVELVDAAGLMLAVQWLGWAGDDWLPPEELRNDWMGEAVRRAGRVRV